MSALSAINEQLGTCCVRMLKAASVLVAVSLLGAGPVSAEGNAVERTANKAAKATERTANRAANATERTAKRATGATERTAKKVDKSLNNAAQKTDNWVKQKTQ